MKPLIHIRYTVFLLLLMPLVLAQDFLPAGEKVLFDEDFKDNHNNWSNVSVVLDKGTAASGTGRITGTVWEAAVPADGAAVSSECVFEPEADLSRGPLSVYASVCLDSAAGGDSNRFYVTLRESTGRRFVNLTIRPGASGSLGYRDSKGATTGKELSSSKGILTDMADTYHFRVTLSAPGGVGEAVRAEAFYYDTSTGEYVSMGSTQEVFLESGLFNGLGITGRNGTKTASFDRVVLTQAQTPAP